MAVRLTKRNKRKASRRVGRKTRSASQRSASQRSASQRGGYKYNTPKGKKQKKTSSKSKLL